MSFGLWWRPVPVDPPGGRDLPTALKYVLAKAGYFDGDGSLKGITTFTVADKPFLRGVVAAGTSEAADGAERLIHLIDGHPAGVDVWIGDGDSF